jgi:cap1 methyltransferase
LWVDRFKYPNIQYPIDIGEYQSKNSISITTQFDWIHVDEAPQIIFCDISLYERLQQAKQHYNDLDIEKIRKLVNPFENIGTSIFMNRAAIKIANIDAVHHICNDIFTYDNRRNNRRFTFCDVAGGPGAFTQYIQYRYPNSYGYGITLRASDNSLNWSPLLDLTRFEEYYGPENKDDGNLYYQWQNYANYVLSKEPQGVDLVMADGGIGMESEDDYQRQEFLSSRLLLTQVLPGILCVKLGGVFVCKVFDTVTLFSAQLLYILSQCFDSIILFKPCSSRPGNSERYIVCKGRKSDITDYIELLSSAAKAYTDEQFVTSLFPEDLPEDFVAWVTHWNNYSINNQLEVSDNIQKYINNEKVVLPQYDITKFLKIWNLPDNKNI